MFEVKRHLIHFAVTKMKKMQHSIFQANVFIHRAILSRKVIRDDASALFISGGFRSTPLTAVP